MKVGVINMMKKMVSLLLAWAFLVVPFSTQCYAAETEEVLSDEDVTRIIDVWVGQIGGTTYYWNKYEGYGESQLKENADKGDFSLDGIGLTRRIGQPHGNTFSAAQSCIGFAKFIGYCLFGTGVETWAKTEGEAVKNVNLRPGDIVYTDNRNGYKNHGAVVWKIENGNVYVIEAWGGNKDSRYYAAIHSGYYTNNYRLAGQKNLLNTVAASGSMVRHRPDTTKTSIKELISVRDTQSSCNHAYNNKGICTLCQEAYICVEVPTSFKGIMRKDANAKAAPYAAQGTVGTLKKGTTVSIVSSAVNHYGNEWYKTSAGSWLYSGDIAEQKLDPPPAPSGLIAQQGESDSATISWAPVNGAAFYEVEYRRNGIDWRTDADYKVKTATSYISTGLADYDSYDYRVRAGNAAGYSPWSEITYVKPVKEECKHQFDNKGVCSLCGETYPLTLTTEKFQARTIKDINLKLLPYAAQETTRRLAKNTTVTITASTVNHYGSAWYRTAEGDWLYSDDIIKQSDEPAYTVSAPAMPANFKVTAAANDTATVSWSAVSGATSYEVQYKRAGIDWRTDGDYTTNTATSYTSTGLANYNSYDYRVRAVNAAGRSEWAYFTYVK